MTRIISSILALIVGLLSLLSCSSQKTLITKVKKEGVRITVTVPKINSSKGKVYFALFNSKESFQQKQAFQSATGSVKQQQTTVTFTDIPKGEYAILCYHDSNENQKFDMKGFMPVEDYGYSNNVVLYGPPEFNPLKFEVQKTDISLEIRFQQLF